MFAIIETGGKQYRVQPGDFVYIDKLRAQGGDTVSFGALLLSDEEGNVKIGAPLVEGVQVNARVVGQVKGEKILVLKYKSKKNYRRTAGHRQPYTQIEITGIG